MDVIPMSDFGVRFGRPQGLNDTAGVPRDKGCDVSPSCLKCPLPICKYDVAGQLPSRQEVRRSERIRAVTRERLTVEQIITRWNVTRRSAFRLRAAALQGKEVY